MAGGWEEGQPREQQEPQSSTPKAGGAGTFLEPWVQADGRCAPEISWVRPAGTETSKHGKEAVLT